MESFGIKTKKAIKRVAAVSSGALVATMTFGGAAVFADLSDYPEPFINAQGQWVGLLVVGADAAPADVIGATNVAAALAQQTVVGPGTGPVVSGGKREEVALNTDLNATANFGNDLDDDDLAGFFDGTVNIDINGTEDDYDAHDILCLGAGTNCPGLAASLQLETGLTLSTIDEDWKSDVFMPVSQKQIAYFLAWDEDLKGGNFFNNASSDDSIIIDFLGNKLEVIGASATSITAQVGEEVFMNVDDTVTVLGSTVQLVNVGSGGAVVVSVNGVQETVTGTEKVGSLRIKVKETFTSDTRAERSATLIIGEDATKSYNDADEYIGEDEDDPNWVWDLSGLDTKDPVLGIFWDQNWDDPEDDPPAVAGGSGDLGPNTFSLPDNYATVTLEGFKENDYKRYTFDRSTEEINGDTKIGTVLASNSSAKLLRLKADGGEENGFKGGNLPKATDEVFIGANSTGHIGLFYKDHDDANKIKSFGLAAAVAAAGADLADQFSINYQDTDITVDISNDLDTTGRISIVLNTDTGSDVNVTAKNDSSGFSGDAYVDIVYGTSSLNGFEEDTRTEGGIIILDPDSHVDPSAGGGKSVEFDVNGDESDFTVNVLISGPGTRVTGGGGQSTLGGVAIARLDTEVSNPAAQNIIAVGGPAVNRLTAQALGLTYPTSGQPGADALGIGAGEGTLMLIDNAFGGTNVALVVAGYDAQNTRDAAEVLQDFSSYSAQLTGDQVIVRSEAGTITVSAPSVAAA
jgi:hypothetical protein